MGQWLSERRYETNVLFDDCKAVGLEKRNGRHLYLLKLRKPGPRFVMPLLAGPFIVLLGTLALDVSGAAELKGCLRYRYLI